SEKIVLYLGRPELRVSMRLLFTQQTAVLGFNSHDPIHRYQLTHRIAIWLSKNNFLSPQSSPKPRRGELQTHDTTPPAVASESIQQCERVRLALSQGRGLR